MNFFSARQIFHDAFVCDYGKPMSIGGGGSTSALTPGSNNQRIVNGCEIGKALAIISKLPKLPRSWGMWCYTEAFTNQDHQNVRQSLFAEWESRHDDFRGDYMKTYRTIVLMNFACEDMKSRLNKGVELPRQDLCTVIEVTKNNIRRDGWLTKLDQMQQMIDVVDRAALVPLAALLRPREANG